VPPRGRKVPVPKGTLGTKGHDRWRQNEGNGEQKRKTERKIRATIRDRGRGEAQKVTSPKSATPRGKGVRRTKNHRKKKLGSSHKEGP